MPKTKDVMLAELADRRFEIECRQRMANSMAQWINNARHELAALQAEVAAASAEAERIRLQCIRLGYIEVKAVRHNPKQLSPSEYDGRFHERSLLIAGLRDHNDKHNNH